MTHVAQSVLLAFIQNQVFVLVWVLAQYIKIEIMMGVNRVSKQSQEKKST